ncbi:MULTISPECIES: hypothetical protein [unclassified Corynebacterium]|uniref:hypothetical protein n=1 Tax=unclassified Corynebacterium TaxID=2624378 RepID=UPI001438C66C|nr:MULTISPECIES: hypothetical protein [unclassified Corynebacterium]
MSSVILGAAPRWFSAVGWDFSALHWPKSEGHLAEGIVGSKNAICTEQKAFLAVKTPFD